MCSVVIPIGNRLDSAAEIACLPQWVVKAAKRDGAEKKAALMLIANTRTALPYTFSSTTTWTSSPPPLFAIPMAFARVFLQRPSSGFSPGPHGACGFHRTPRSIVECEPNDLRPSLRSHYRGITGSTSAFQHRSSSLSFFVCFVPSRRQHADTFPCSNDSIYAYTLLGPDYEPAGLGTSRRSSPMPSLFFGPC